MDDDVDVDVDDDVGSIPRFSSLFSSNVVVYVHSLATLPLSMSETLE